jgi:FkbM family methyltransferase
MIKQIVKKILYKLGYKINLVKIDKEEVENKYFKFKENDLNYYETPIGNYYLPNKVKNDIIINTMKKGELFDINIINVAEKYIKQGTCVIDIGCNLGQMGIYFSKLVGNEGKVYSFEADDYIYEILKKNLIANNCLNIEPIFGAVYNENNKILYFPKQDFIRFQAYGSYGLDLNSKNGREVKSLTIDSINFQNPVSFMKVDIQGSDLFALEGAKQTILKYRMPIIFEFEERFQKEFNTTFQDYVDFVDSIQYKFIETIDGINYLIIPK